MSTRYDMYVHKI